MYGAQALYDQALQSFQQALIIAREVGDRAGEANTLSNIASAYAAQGLTDRARATYYEALIIARDIGAKPMEDQILANLNSLPPA